jgi:hypothetical protein
MKRFLFLPLLFAFYSGSASAQIAHHAFSSSSTQAPGGSNTVTLTANAGDFVWVGISVQSTVSITAVADGVNTYVQDPNSPQINLGNGQTAIYTASNVAGGTSTIRVTWSTAPNTYFIEAVDLPCNCVRDNSVGANFSNSAVPSAGTLAASSSAKFLLGVVAVPPLATDPSYSATNSYGILNSAARGGAESRTISSGGSYSDGWSLNEATNGAVMLSSYKVVNTLENVSLTLSANLKYDDQTMVTGTVVVRECEANCSSTQAVWSQLKSATIDSSGNVDTVLGISTSFVDSPEFNFVLFDPNGNLVGTIAVTIPGAMFKTVHSVKGSQIVISKSSCLAGACTLAAGSTMGVLGS